MSATTTSARVTALCCECGTVRDVAERYMGLPERRLRCATCRHTTLHARVLADAERDWRERDNLESEPRLPKVLDDFKALGVRVEFLANEADPEATKEGRVTSASLLQYLDDGQWWLTIYEDADLEDVLIALDKLWRQFLARDETTWFVDPARDGEPAFRSMGYSVTRPTSGGAR